MRQTNLILTLIIGGLMLVTSSARSQADNPQTVVTEEPDPVVEALERQKKIAELEKAIAEAEKATLTAKLPATEGSGVTGTATFGEGSGYFAEMLAYQSLLNAVGEVTKLLGPPSQEGEKVVVVTGDELAKSAVLWEIASARVDDASQRLQALLAKYPSTYAFATDEAVATALTTATALLGSAADIASFFRSDLTVTARTVNVTSGALIAAATAKLRDLKWKPVLPASSLTKPSLLVKIEELLQTRRELTNRRRELEEGVKPKLVELAKLNLELEVAKAALVAAKKAKPSEAAKIQAAEEAVRELQGKILPLGIRKARWDRVATEIDATLTATDALVKALVEGAEGKPSAVEAVAAVDVVKSDPALKILRLEISSQGGEIHVSKSVWRTRLTYVGGVVVSYVLMDQEGGVEKSGVVEHPIAKSTRAKDAATALSIGGADGGGSNAGGKK
jgi:hypothetical protein